MENISEETYFHLKLVPILSDLILKFQPLVKLNIFDQHNIYSEAKSLSDKYLQDGLDNLLFVPESNREELKLFTNYLKNREY